MTEGWAAIPNWIVRDPKVGPNALAVYAVIQSHAGSKGTTALRHKTIAFEAGVSEKTVKRSVAVLKGLGVLWWEGRKTKEGFLANVYHPLQEQNEGLVEGNHSPHAPRVPERTVSPARVDSDPNWDTRNREDSGEVVGLTVQPERTQGPQGGGVSQTPGVGSHRPTKEEEPIEEEPPTPEPASPWDELPVPEGWWSLSFRPHAEAYKAALANYPDSDPYERTVAYITWSRAKERDMTSQGWIRFMQSEQKRVDDKRREGVWGPDDYRREREKEKGMTMEEEMQQLVIAARDMRPPGRAARLNTLIAQGVPLPEEDQAWLNEWSGA